MTNAVVKYRAAGFTTRFRLPSVPSLLLGQQDMPRSSTATPGGNTRTEAHLRRALARENLDNVRQAIGGALKKLNYDSTRVHESQLSKALQPPETQDPTLKALMDRLEQLEWKTDSAEIVAVRAKIKNHDPDFFNSYMAWVKRKPGIVAALQDNRIVFRN